MKPRKAWADRLVFADMVIRPLQEFIRLESVGGILLLGSTVVAMGWANSPWAEAYFRLWRTEISFTIGGSMLSKSVLHWINDGLMVVFFFVVGLEIKREVLIGELSSPGQSLLPIAAALGGMLMPAALYALFNRDTEGLQGWGIPMATDIAFAVGILSLLGKRVPLGLKVFLTALAIVDDLGAVLVIALFYTAELSLTSLLWAGGVLALLFVVNRMNIHFASAYLLLGVALWLAFLTSGVHPTVAGVLLAVTIPGRASIDKRRFAEQGRALVGAFLANPSAGGKHNHTAEDEQGIVQALEKACKQVETPMQRLEHMLHPWVAFGILPLFALANAGVSVSTAMSLTDPIALGIILGLVLGKQAGITFFSWLVVRLKLAPLPSGVSWAHVYGAGWLGGIGFTMSLFVAMLAFGESSSLETAKIGILVASFAAGAGGLIILSRAFRAG